MQNNIKISKSISTLYLGINWGATNEKGWFDGRETHGVDLDLGAFIIQNNKIIDRLFYAKNNSQGIVSANLSIDDNTGDLHGNDYLDNEIITINFDDEDDDEFSVIFFLISYSELPFGEIPYVQCRAYDGFPNKADNIYLDFDYSKMVNFKNATGMIIAQLNVLNKNKELIPFNKLLFDTDLIKIEKLIKKELL